MLVPTFFKNRIKTIYPLWIKQRVWFGVQQETPEEGYRAYQPKHEYSNKDEDNNLYILNDKNAVFHLVAWKQRGYLVKSPFIKDQHLH